MVHEHSSKHLNSLVFKHLTETDHSTVTIDDSRVLETGYCQKKFRGKLSGLLFIKQNKST